MTSAATVAETLTEWRRRNRALLAFFAVAVAVFGYTITVTISDCPEGLRIAAAFNA